MQLLAALFGLQAQGCRLRLNQAGLQAQLCNLLFAAFTLHLQPLGLPLQLLLCIELLLLGVIEPPRCIGLRDQPSPPGNKGFDLGGDHVLCGGTGGIRTGLGLGHP